MRMVRIESRQSGPGRSGRLSENAFLMPSRKCISCSVRCLVRMITRQPSRVTSSNYSDTVPLASKFTRNLIVCDFLSHPKKPCRNISIQRCSGVLVDPLQRSLRTFGKLCPTLIFTLQTLGKLYCRMDEVFLGFCFFSNAFDCLVPSFLEGLVFNFEVVGSKFAVSLTVEGR